jgi:translation initiation factor 3 subunit A
MQIKYFLFFFRLQEEKLQEIKQRHIEETVKNIAQTEIGKKVLSKMDEKEIAELDTDKIMMKQVEELENEKRQLIARLKSQEKRVDHLERAKRKEEIPLLLEASKQVNSTILLK